MKRNLAVALAALSLTVLGACAGPATGPAGPPAFEDGYKDGCSSGRAAQGSMFDFPRKDAGRFASDAQYAKGWTEGYQKCEALQVQKNSAGNGGH